MKLDRNVNRGGRGKYALVNMRKLIPMIDQVNEAIDRNEQTGSDDVVAAFQILVERGIITLGTESPGDQFFVMKYKDKFTAPALKVYADSVYQEAMVLLKLKSSMDRKDVDSLLEYSAQVRREAERAKILGDRIPD